MAPTMQTGYAFETPAPADWFRCSSELWDTVVHTAAGAERFVGIRRIDGTRVNVWEGTGVFLAQTALAQ